MKGRRDKNKEQQQRTKGTKEVRFPSSLLYFFAVTLCSHSDFFAMAPARVDVGCAASRPCVSAARVHNCGLFAGRRQPCDSIAPPCLGRRKTTVSKAASVTPETEEAHIEKDQRLDFRA